MFEQVTVDRKDFQELLINAVRYALPRASYITAVMFDLLEKYMEVVDKRTLYQIRVDILNQKHRYGLDIGWREGLSGPVDFVANDCFRRRFGLQETDQVDYCSWCNSMTKIEIDRGGHRYCARCGRIKDGPKC